MLVDRNLNDQVVNRGDKKINLQESSPEALW